MEFTEAFLSSVAKFAGAPVDSGSDIFVLNSEENQKFWKSYCCEKYPDVCKRDTVPRPHKSWLGYAISIHAKHGHTRCFECGGRAYGKPKPMPLASGTVNRYLCEKCRVLPQHRLICKTTAKSIYMLTETHLKDLPSVEVDNPHYRSAASMVLFHEHSVRDYALSTYGEEEMNNKREMKQRRADEREAQREKERQEAEHRAFIEEQERKQKEQLRKEQLILVLQNEGLAFHNDSGACNGYIRGEEKSVETVIGILRERKFMLEHVKHGTSPNHTPFDGHWRGYRTIPYEAKDRFREWLRRNRNDPEKTALFPSDRIRNLAQSLIHEIEREEKQKLDKSAETITKPKKKKKRSNAQRSAESQALNS